MSTRNGFTSLTTTRAPRCRHTIAMSAPMGPPPKTSTASPAFTSARRTSCVATASGSITAASSSSSDAGTRSRRSVGTVPVLLHAARLLHAEHAQAIAEIGRAHAAGAAGAAHAQRLHHHALARAEARGARRLGDLGQRLVADDAAARDAVVEVALEDVQIGAADADAPHAQQRLAGRRLRHRRGADAELPRRPRRMTRASAALRRAPPDHVDLRFAPRRQHPALPALALLLAGELAMRASHARPGRPDPPAPARAPSRRSSPAASSSER